VKPEVTELGHGPGSPTSSAWCSPVATADQLHPHLASQAFARAQRAVAVTPIRFHDNRHTHATLLLRDRVPIKVASERLGHSTPAFTMTTYQHVLPGMQDDAARAFAAILTNGHSVATGSDR
jgi:integrase